jgi:predicted outer membrane protein
MLRVLSMLSLTAIGAVAFAQTQSPPTAPRTQSPAQDNANPGGLQNPQPGVGQPAQPGQPGYQNQQQPIQGAQQRTANFRGELGGQANAQIIDGQLAACLILGNEEEIALGKFASQHASSDKVKKFAQMMVDQHTQAASQLKQFAPRGVSLQLSDAGNNQARNERAATGSDQIGQQMLTIMRDAKQECLNMTEKELGQKHGEEFDHAYIGQQMGGHVQMIAALTAFEKHASPELQRVVSEQKKTAEQHLDHLKQLVEKTAPESRTN